MAGWVLSCSDRLANDATMPDRSNTFSGDSFPKSAFVNRFSVIPFGKDLCQLDIHICIGWYRVYMLPTIGGYMSIEGVCAP